MTTDQDVTSGRALTRLHAHEAAARLRAGDLSSLELLEAHLQLIAEQDHALHAWLAVDADRRAGRCPVG